MVAEPMEAAVPELVVLEQIIHPQQARYLYRYQLFQLQLVLVVKEDLLKLRVLIQFFQQ